MFFGHFLNFGFRGLLLKLQKYFSALKNDPRKGKMQVQVRLYEFSKNPKGQVDSTNGLARATLLVRRVLGHSEHFFPVLQLLDHIYIIKDHVTFKSIR